jgi:hypothetical protein
MGIEGMAVPIQRHEARILTATFQFSGQLEVVGALLNFINDPNRDSFSLYDANLTPLTPGSPLKGIFRPHVVVRRPYIAFLYLASAETRASLKLLARHESLVAYTPIAVCRGEFHMSIEANLRDFLDASPGGLIAVSEAQLFPLIEFPAPFPTEADLLMIGRAQLQSYHLA